MKAKVFFFILAVSFFDAHPMDISKKSPRGMLPLPKAESIVVSVQGSLGLHAQSSNTSQIREKLTDIILKASSAHRKQLDCSLLGINVAAFKPNTTEFVCAYNNLLEQPLKIWPDHKNADPIWCKLNEEISIKCLAFSYDGDVLLSGIGNVLYFCDTKTWQSTRNLLIDIIQDIKTAAFSKRGHGIIVGGSSGKNNLIVMSKQSGSNVMYALPGHQEGTISCVGFSPDGTKAISVCENTCKMWDIANKKTIFEDNGTSWSNCKVEYDTNNGWFLTGCDDVLGCWFSYDLNNRKKVMVPLKGKIIPRIKAYDRSPCGTYIFLADAHASGDVYVFNVYTGRYICTYNLPGCGVSTIACSDDGTSLVVAIREICGNADLFVYDLKHQDDFKALQAVSNLSPIQIDFVSTIITKRYPLDLEESEHKIFSDLPHALKELLGRYVISPASFEEHDFTLINDEWHVIEK